MLHFSPTSRTFTDCVGAEKELKKYLTDYEKTEKYYKKPNNDIWQKLKSHLKTACQNAKKLGSFDANNDRKALAEMWLLFEEDAFKGLVEIKGK